jgi:glutamine synthetase
MHPKQERSSGACDDSGGALRAGGHAEAALGQWSYCVGPCRGIELGDQLWASRFILLRMADQFRLTASLDPKPLPGDWPGNGAHVKV